MGNYVLIKRKGSKRYIGAIPVKKGVPISKVKRAIATKLKKSFSAKIITSATLQRLLKKKKAASKGKRRTVRRTTRRRKTSRRRTRR